MLGNLPIPDGKFFISGSVVYCSLLSRVVAPHCISDAGVTSSPLFGWVVRARFSGNARVRTVCMSLSGLTFLVGSESTKLN